MSKNLGTLGIRYLYRGINLEMYKNTGGRLEPKAIGEPFKRTVGYNQDFKYGEITYGDSTQNAIVGHQKNSHKFPTSGISTTPVFGNAKAYATHKGKSGYVFKIDTELLESANVSHHVVSECVKKPTIPEDKEIILVSCDYGALPEDIVVDIISVHA